MEEEIRYNHNLYTLTNNIITNACRRELPVGVGCIPYDLIRVHYRGPVQMPPPGENLHIDGVTVVKRFDLRTGACVRKKVKPSRCGRYLRMEQREYRGRGQFTVCLGPEYSRMPTMVVSINPSKLRLSPRELGELIARYMPIDSARVAYAECKLDFKDTDAKELADLVSVKFARTRLKKSDTSFGFGRRRSKTRVNIYDKGKQLGTDVKGLARLEVQVRIPPSDRPTVAEFISGAWKPQDPFARIRLMDVDRLPKMKQGLQDLVEAEGVHNGLKAYGKVTSRRRCDTAKKHLLHDAVELGEAWSSLLEEWYRSDAGTACDGLGCIAQH